MLINSKNIADAPPGTQPSGNDAQQSENPPEVLYKDRPLADLINVNDGNYNYYLADEAGEDHDAVEEREDILVF